MHDWFSHGKNEEQNPWVVPLADDDPWPERPMRIERTRRDPSADPDGPPTFVTDDTHDEVGRHMLERGHEYGTTTGRERRCGWIDLVALRYAVRLNRMSALTITKLDVLSGLDPLRVAVRYRSSEGAVFDRFPYHQSILHSAVPEYEELPGFQADLTACRSEADLPPQARAYLDYIAEFAGVPIRLVGVGPDRDQVIWIGDEVGLRAA